jgi:hypothetical protein
LSLVFCRSSFVARLLSLVFCRSSFVARLLSLVFCRSSLTFAGREPVPNPVLIGVVGWRSAARSRGIGRCCRAALRAR